MSVRIVVNDAQLSQGLKALQDRMVNLRPFFADIGEILLNSTRQRFASETSPDGAKWTRLSPAYAKWKARKGRSKTILQLNGYLFGSLSYQAGDDKVEVGSNRIYAGIHQFGSQVSSRSKANIPARPFLGFSESDASAVRTRLEEYLIQGLG